MRVATLLRLPGLLGVRPQPIRVAASPFVSSATQISQLKGLLRQARGFFQIPVKGYLKIWASHTSGPEMLPESKATPLFRCFAQVDPIQIPEAVDLLTQVAQTRARQNKPTAFKFLVASLPKDPKVKRPELVSKRYARKHAGTYADKDPARPVIAIYTETAEQRDEILETLRKVVGWEAIEQNRTHSQPRAGAKPFIDKDGREWKTLCYTPKAGLTERVTGQR